MPERVTERRFQKTRWTLIRKAGEGSPEALAALCRAYWPPVCAFIQSRPWLPGEATDLTQEFFASQILPTHKAQLLLSVNREKRFRNWLLGAVCNHLRNAKDAHRTQGRNGGVPPISLDQLIVEQDCTFGHESVTWDKGHQLTPERAYYRRWALVVLERALDRLEAAEQGGEYFAALRPLLVGPEGERPEYRELAKRFDKTVGAVKVKVHHLRCDFADHLYEEVVDTLADPDDVADEMRFLYEALSPPSASSTIWTCRD